MYKRTDHRTVLQRDRGGREKKMKMLAKGPDDTKGSRVGPLFSVSKKRDKTRKKREGVPSLLYFLPGQHFLLLPPSPSYFSVCPRGRQSQFLEQPPKERKTGRGQTWCVKTSPPPMSQLRLSPGPHSEIRECILSRCRWGGCPAEASSGVETAALNSKVNWCRGGHILGIFLWGTLCWTVL